MVEDCYILYSCDGSYEPIVSNFSGLSAHSSSYVRVYLTDPVDGIPDTCFYVLSLGSIDCQVNYGVTSVTGDTCSCPCYCYFIRSASQTTDVTYVNCDDEIVVDTIQEGLTYNICSKVYPQFDTPTQIPIKLTDICQNGQCPPTIPTVKPKNECDVITIFPMDVNCLVQQPSNDQSFDGSAALVITGGTPPYTIFWEIGSFAPALTNLGIGDYTATVTDYYGDFSATTTCVLTAETLTISGMCFVVSGLVEDNVVYVNSQKVGMKNGKPYYFLQYGVVDLGYVFFDGATDSWLFCETLECQGNPFNKLISQEFYPTGGTGDWLVVSDTQLIITESYVGSCSIPVIPKEETNLCVTFTTRNDKEYLNPIQSTNVQFYPSTVINGEPSWTASTNPYVIYWNSSVTPNQWELTGYPFTNIINYDSSYPPLSNWQISGPPTLLNMSVVSGSCSTAYTISLIVNKNNGACEEGGEILVTASGGIAPYQYSINGGQSYQQSPIFNNLPTGNYNVQVLDSNNIISQVVQTSIVTSPPTSYTVTLNANYVNNTFNIVAPSLPSGVTISLNLVINIQTGFYPSTLVPQPLFLTVGYVTGTSITNLITSNNSQSALTGPCTSSGPITISQSQRALSYPLTLTSNQVVTGNTINSIGLFSVGSCKGAKSTYSLSLTSATLNNCNCCNVVTVNPQLRPPLTFP